MSSSLQRAAIACFMVLVAGCLSEDEELELATIEQAVEVVDEADINQCLGACGWKCNACSSVTTEYAGHCEGSLYVYTVKHHQSCPTASCCEAHDLCQRSYCTLANGFDWDRCAECQAQAVLTGCIPCLDGNCGGTTNKAYDEWSESRSRYGEPMCQGSGDGDGDGDDGGGDDGGGDDGGWCFYDCYWGDWESCEVCSNWCGYSDCTSGCNSNSGNCYEDDEYGY